MQDLKLTHSPVAKAEMLIRRPVDQVFEAFVNPAITSQFWFTKGSGRLEIGKQVEWSWEMYGFSLPIKAKAIEPNQRILIEFPADTSTTVEWIFKERADQTTFVSITSQGFSGSADEIVQGAINTTEGFTFVLAGAKAFLEKNIQLNLVRDRFPDGLKEE